MSPAIPDPIPHGRTARRLEWAHLPPAVRATIERALRLAGGVGGLAGRRVHARLRLGADLRGRLAALREGGVGGRPADVRRVLPRGGAQARGPCPRHVPAPRLLWTHGRRLGGARPGVRRGAGAAPTVAAGRARPLPRRARDGGRPAHARRRRASTLDPITDELAAWPAYWDHVRRHPRPPARRRGRRARGGLRRGRRAARRSSTPTCATTTSCSTTDGRALFCDWNWPTVGADWLDSLFMLIGPRGDGLDVEAVIAERRAAARRTRRARRPRAGRALRLLPAAGRRAGAADLAVHPRRPALAGRGGAGTGCASAAAGRRPDRPST